MRSNWFELLQFLLWPTFAYLAAGAIAGSSLSDKIPEATFRSVVLTLSIVMMLIYRWALTLRMYAILMVISGRSNNLNAALNISTPEKIQLLLVTSPAFVMDLFELGCLIIGHSLKDAHIEGLSHQTSLLAAASLDVFALLVLFPATWLITTISILLATLVQENLTLPNAFARFFSLTSRAPGYFWMYTSLLAVIAYLLIWLASIGECLELLSNFCSGVSKEIVYWLMSFLAVLIETPGIALLNAALAIGGACFHSQLRMRLEGTDLLNRITTL